MKFYTANTCNADEKRWKGFTLLMPAVSIGNVGQLTIDLLISTSMPKLAGYIYSDCLIPVVGSNPIDAKLKNLTTSIDVYEDPNLRIVILQQRAPFIKIKQKHFIDELVMWIEYVSFEKVLLFSSTLACERMDSQLKGSQFRYLLSDKGKALFSETLNLCSDMIPLEKRQLLNDNSSQVAGQHSPSHDIRIADVQESEAVNLPSDQFLNTNLGMTQLKIENSIEKSGKDLDPYIPGSGLAKSLLHVCNSRNIGLLIMIKFCYEADNISDAVQLATLADSIFCWVQSQKEKPSNKSSRWKYPQSWKLLFGNSLNQVLYQ